MLCQRCQGQFTLLPTRRQIQIAKMLAGGLRTKEIATELGISPFTVKAHKEQAMDRLGIHNTSQLVAWAVASGHVDKKEVLEKE